MSHPLGDMVRAGWLPAVAQRLPDGPLVLKPVHEVGKHGGH